MKRVYWIGYSFFSISRAKGAERRQREREKIQYFSIVWLWSIMMNTRVCLVIELWSVWRRSRKKSSRIDTFFLSSSFQGINAEWRLFVYSSVFFFFFFFFSPPVIIRRRDWKSFSRRDKSLTWTLLRINNARKWFNRWLSWLSRCCLDFLVVFL